MSRLRKEQKKRDQIHKKLLQGRPAELTGPQKWHSLFGPVDNASMVVFRIVFGGIMFWEVIRYFKNGWIEDYWIKPRFHFTYFPFDFVSPLPGNGMYYLFYFLGFLALCIAAGFLYRLSMTLFFLCFTYCFLLEQARYLNHFYLIVLLSLVMIFIPAHRAYSIDARIKPSIRSDVAPAWSLWLLRFMIAIPYFFGGVAKLNADWLRGEPMRMWVSGDRDFPVIGPFLGEDWMIYSIVYAGLLLDLFIVPALLYRKTRTVAFVLITLFHLMNVRFFQIGIFPWMMIGATTIFLDPGWPRRFLRKKEPVILREEDSPPATLGYKHKWILGLLGLWFLIQVLAPFRHLLYPGRVDWTEEGHNYSWHMKLRSKTGEARFIVKDKATGNKNYINGRKYFTRWQYQKMVARPDMIWQAAQMIRKEHQEKGRQVEVYADVMASLNGRKFQPLIDTTVDLTAVDRPGLGSINWVIPLYTPLKDRLISGHVDDNETAEMKE